MSSLQIEQYVRDHIVEIAEDVFPDNTGIEWIIHRFQHTPDLVLAEVEPRPDVVGYPRFRFAFLKTHSGTPQCIATYCLETGRFSLLCTSRGAPRNLPRQLD